MKKQESTAQAKVIALGKTGKKKTLRILNRYPLVSFIGLLALLFLLILVGSLLRKPDETTTQVDTTPIPVSVFEIGGTPQITVQAQVEKAGVIQIVAQSAGVVQQLRVTEGDRVSRGTVLVNMSTNYQGGSLPGLSRQIAQKNYQFAQDNYQAQLSLLDKRRSLATNAEAQAADLRSIADQSLGDTRTLITLQEEQYKLLDQEIERLEALGEDFATNPVLQQFQPARAGALSALSSLRQALRNTEYQVDGDNPPAQMAQLQRDLTLQQLELEEKSLNLNQDLAKLNLRISQISESLLYPASPCPGVVERVYVKVGQSVTPGTVIATISADDSVSDLVALVPSAVASELTTIEPSLVQVKGQEWQLYPRYVSSEPTDGVLHAVIFTLPTEIANQVAQREYLSVKLPLGLPKLETDPYIPVDAVFQTEDAAFVYVVEESEGQKKTGVREITLDQIMGKYVMALTGLQDTDLVIVSRNIAEGDLIEVK